MFVAIFMLEAITKIIGLGGLYYFSFDQNKFDFALVIISIFGLIENFIRINVTALRVSRGARILRVFKSLH